MEGQRRRLCLLSCGMPGRRTGRAIEGWLLTRKWIHADGADTSSLLGNWLLALLIVFTRLVIQKIRPLVEIIAEQIANLFAHPLRNAFRPPQQGFFVGHQFIDLFIRGILLRSVAAVAHGRCSREVSGDDNWGGNHRAVNWVTSAQLRLRRGIPSTKKPFPA